MITTFLDREIERLESLNEGQYKLNTSGHAKLTEFKAIKQALTIPVIMGTLKCDCVHSGSCRYEEVILDSKEICRNKE